MGDQVSSTKRDLTPSGQRPAHSGVNPDAGACPRPTGDRGYDADWLRDAMQARYQALHPRSQPHLDPVRHDRGRYRRRSRIEIIFGYMKDCRRIATRYDRRRTAFFSAAALAATVSLSP